MIGNALWLRKLTQNCPSPNTCAESALQPPSAPSSSIHIHHYPRPSFTSYPVSVFLFSLFFILICVHHQPHPERSASTCNGFSEYLFFVFSLHSSTPSVCSYPRPHTTHLHARPSACKTICTQDHPHARPSTRKIIHTQDHPHARPSACKTICMQHIPVCMLPFQVSFYFFLLFFFALIGISTQHHQHTTHSCLHAPIPSNFLFFLSSLFFLHSLASAHPHAVSLLFLSFSSMLIRICMPTCWSTHAHLHSYTHHLQGELISFSFVFLYSIHSAHQCVMPMHAHTSA